MAIRQMTKDELRSFLGHDQPAPYANEGQSLVPKEVVYQSILEGERKRILKNHIRAAQEQIAEWREKNVNGVIGDWYQALNSIDKQATQFLLGLVTLPVEGFKAQYERMKKAGEKSEELGYGYMSGVKSALGIQPHYYHYKDLTPEQLQRRKDLEKAAEEGMKAGAESLERGDVTRWLIEAFRADFEDDAPEPVGLEAMEWGMNRIQKVAKKAGDSAYDLTGDPDLAAMAYTAVEFGIYVAGGKAARSSYGRFMKSLEPWREARAKGKRLSKVAHERYKAKSIEAANEILRERIRKLKTNEDRRTIYSLTQAEAAELARLHAERLFDRKKGVDFQEGEFVEKAQRYKELKGKAGEARTEGRPLSRLTEKERRIAILDHAKYFREKREMLYAQARQRAEWMRNAELRGKVVNEGLHALTPEELEVARNMGMVGSPVMIQRVGPAKAPAPAGYPARRGARSRIGKEEPSVRPVKPEMPEEVKSSVGSPLLRDNYLIGERASRPPVLPKDPPRAKPEARVELFPDQKSKLVQLEMERDSLVSVGQPLLTDRISLRERAPRPPRKKADPAEWSERAKDKHTLLTSKLKGVEQRISKAKDNIETVEKPEARAVRMNLIKNLARDRENALNTYSHTDMVERSVAKNADAIGVIEKPEGKPTTKLRKKKPSTKIKYTRVKESGLPSIPELKEPVAPEMLEPVKPYAEGYPYKTDMWYDRYTKDWVIQTLDREGNQIGEATRVYGKEDALRERKWAEERIISSAEKRADRGEAGNPVSVDMWRDKVRKEWVIDTIDTKGELLRRQRVKGQKKTADRIYKETQERVFPWDFDRKAVVLPHKNRGNLPTSEWDAEYVLSMTMEEMLARGDDALKPLIKSQRDVTKWENFFEEAKSRAIGWFKDAEIRLLPYDVKDRIINNIRKMKPDRFYDKSLERENLGRVRKDTTTGEITLGMGFGQQLYETVRKVWNNRITKNQAITAASLVKANAEYLGISPAKWLGEYMASITERGKKHKGIEYANAARRQWDRKSSGKQNENLIHLEEYIKDAYGTDEALNYMDEVRRFINRNSVQYRDGKSAIKFNDKTLMSVDLGDCGMGQKCVHCYAYGPAAVEDLGGLQGPQSAMRVVSRTEYNRQILEMPDVLVDFLNERTGGLRVFAGGDMKPELAPDIVRIIQHANKRGLILKFITKQPRMVLPLLKNSRHRVNISIDFLPENADYIANPKKYPELNKIIKHPTASLMIKRMDYSLDDIARWKKQYGASRVKSRYVALNYWDALAAIMNKKVDVVTLFHAQSAKPEVMYRRITAMNPDMSRIIGEKTLRQLSEVFELKSTQTFTTKGSVPLEHIKRVAGKNAKESDFLSKARGKLCCQTKCGTCPICCGFGRKTTSSMARDFLEGMPQMGVEFIENGKAVLHAFQKTDISDVVYSLGHIFRATLRSEEEAIARRALGVKGSAWNRPQMERFARQFEQYVKKGKAPTSDLQPVFKKLSRWMSGIYKELKRSNVPVNDELKQVFDTMLGKELTEKLDLSYKINDGKVPKTTNRDAGMVVQRSRGGEVTLESFGFQTMYEEFVSRWLARNKVQNRKIRDSKLNAMERAAIVKHRTIRGKGKGKEALKAPPIWEVENQLIYELKSRNLPYYIIKERTGGTSIIESPIRAFEALGPEYKELFYRPIKQAEYEIAAELRALRARTDVLKKSLGPWYKRPYHAKRIGIYAVAQQKGGLHMLKREMKIKEIPELTPAEMNVYQALRNEYESFYTRLNEARKMSGVEPFPKVDNYFTFFRIINILDEYKGFNPVRTKLSTMNPAMVHLRATPFRFAKERIPKGSYPLVLDAFEMFDRYSVPAVRHIHISPRTAKFHELIDTELPVPGVAGKTYTLKDLNFDVYAFIRNWVDHQAGMTKSVLPHKVERAVKRLQTNIAFAILGANFRSWFVQSSALRNIFVEVGTRDLMKGVAEELKGAFGEKVASDPMKRSNVLLPRTFDVNANDALSALRAGRILGFRRKAGKAAMWPLQQMDLITARIAWRAAYHHGRRMGLSKRNAELFADDMVIKTQASGAPSDIAPIQRTTEGRAVTIFQTFVINEWNWLTRDVLGLRNPMMKNKERVTKIGRLLVATAIVNTIYEDLFGLPSPFPSPIKAFLRARNEGKTTDQTLSEAGQELLEQFPIVGGSFRYGTHPLGAMAQTIAETTEVPQRPVGVETLFLMGKLSGVPGSAQVRKSYKAHKRGESLYGVIVGRYTPPKPKPKRSRGRGRRSSRSQRTER